MRSILPTCVAFEAEAQALASSFGEALVFLGGLDLLDPEMGLETAAGIDDEGGWQSAVEHLVHFAAEAFALGVEFFGAALGVFVARG